MKIRWTLSLTAIALVVGAFPAFAHQSQLPAPKSPERQKLDRKIDAVSKTPFMTPHQGDNLKKVVDGGERMKQEEKLTQPNPFQPGMQSTSQAPAPGQPQAAPGEAQPNANPAPQEQKEEAKPEPAKPEFRLMGTVCGKGAPLAVFDKGGEWPTMLKAGDNLDEQTKVVSVARGKVCLERIVSPAQPAVPAQQGPDGQPIAGQPAKPKKKERYELYAW